MNKIIFAVIALLSPLAFGQASSGLPAPNSASIYANAGSTGTTVNTLTKLTGAPSTAVIAATTDTSGVVGITVAGAGTSGSATVQSNGVASLVFDGATTAGDYVQISSSVAGNGHDFGAACPTSGQVVGRVLTTNGSGGTYKVTLGSNGCGGGGGGGNYVNLCATVTATASTGSVTCSGGVLTVGSSTNSVTIASIPGTYNKIILDYAGKTAASADLLMMQMNVDTNQGHYACNRTGSSAVATCTTTGTPTNAGAFLGQLDASSGWAGGSMEILGYATSNPKILNGQTFQAGSEYQFGGSWSGSGALTSLMISSFSAAGNQIAAGTTFIIYGVL